MKMNISYKTVGDSLSQEKLNELNKNQSASLLNSHQIIKSNSNLRSGEINSIRDSSHKALSVRSRIQSNNQKLTGDSFYKQSDDIYNNSKRHIRTATHIGFGTSSRREHLAIKKETPGPGEYNLNHLMGKEGPKYTMSARVERTTSKKSFIPGPGQYSIHSINKPSSPSFRMGTSNREGVIGFAKNIPGPAQYKPNNFINSFYQKSPNWTMGTAPRKSCRVDEMGPGPGNYNLSKGLGSGPKYSITGKNWEMNKKTTNPGPGQYDNEAIKLMHKNPSWKMGTATREDKINLLIRENRSQLNNYKSNLQKL